jgi:hypothetical protein
MPTISLGKAAAHLHVWLMTMAAWVWLTDGLCCSVYALCDQFFG